MRLWRKAAGSLKDKNSLWLANATPLTKIRNPYIEKDVIRATSHNCLVFNYPRIDRVIEWLAISPTNLKPLLWAISFRMEKTRDWVVALKGLHLLHLIATTKFPCVRQIGRLPLDLSCFRDGQSSYSKAWPFNAFIRAYYAFLDQKYVMVFQHGDEKASSKGNAIMQELILLQKLQGLIDLLMQMKPKARAVIVPMILDVMDAIIVEVEDLHTRICTGIVLVLMKIYSASKDEATVTLNVVLKATKQADELNSYIEFCQKIGVPKASNIRAIERIPEEGIRELRQIIESLSDGFGSNEKRELPMHSKEEKTAVKESNERKYLNGNHFKTVITDKWEKFDEHMDPSNPFAGPLITHELPDLIIL